MTKKHPPHSHQTPVIINKDGTLNIHRPRNPGRFFFDLYHYLLSISWPKFFALIIGVFFCANLLFGALYFTAGPNALEGIHTENTIERLWDCFLFSVQSLDSPFSPVGFLANFLVTLESYLGMLTLVIVTGLLYARFARPNARVIFSNDMLINQYDGKPCLTFRVANERLNQIIEARMTLTLSKMATSQEGETSRKLYPMRLETDYSPLFALSWTIRHFIDTDSPMHGMDAKKMEDDLVAIFATLTGIDDTFSQSISARNVYRYDEIVYNKRFKDIILWDKGKVRIDLKGIHAYQ